MKHQQMYTSFKCLEEKSQKKRFISTYSSKDLAWFCIVYYIIMYPVHANLFFVLLFRLGNDAVKNKYHMNKIFKKGSYDNKKYVVSCQIPIVYSRENFFWAEKNNFCYCSNHAYLTYFLSYYIYIYISLDVLFILLYRL